MQSMNSRTTIRTEYAGLGLKPDGTWRKITAGTHTAADAEEQLKEYISDVSRYPDLYTAYAEYKVKKRTIITTIEDWSDAE